MKDDEDPGRPSEGQPQKKGGGLASGCAGCFLPLIIGVLVTYCTIDASDFYFSPGEINLWPDAMEEVFDNLDQVTPDSLFIDDDLNVLEHSDKVINKENIMYGLHPFIRVKSKDNPENAYLMRVIGIVLHAGPNDFRLRTMEMDTLIAIPKRKPQAP